MPIDEKNLVRHELIGLEAEIAKTKTKGKIINETQKTLTIRTDKKETIVAKNECKFIITLPTGTIIEVEGKLLLGRPEERIKKKLPKKWDAI